MSETDSNDESAPKELSLLERLRRKLVLVEPSTEEEASTLRDLIIDHVHELPNKLRPAIAKASEKKVNSPALEFINDFFITVVFFFMGRSLVHRSINMEERRFSLREWHGLDSEIDTEEEAEVLIRLFPNVFHIKLITTPNIDLCPLTLFFSSTKAVSFIPIFVKLGVEMGLKRALMPPESIRRLPLDDDDAVLLISQQLLVNRSGYKFSLGVFDEQASDSLDEKSLEALIQMRKYGLIQDGEVYKLIIWLLVSADEVPGSFIEPRLKLLIGWNPSVLRECGKGDPNLLHEFLDYYTSDEDPVTIRKNIQRLFRLVFGLGMTHFPLDFGFIFYKDNYYDYNNACTLPGTTRVIPKIIEEELLRILRDPNNNISISDLVLSAATNEDISLDGLYTLIRSNPNAALMLEAPVKTLKRTILNLSQQPDRKKIKTTSLQAESRPNVRIDCVKNLCGIRIVRKILA